PGREAEVGELAERLIEVVADVRRGDLVRGDVVAEPALQLGRQLQVLAGELAPDELRIVHQEEDPALEPDLRGKLFDLPGEERGYHGRWSEVESRRRRRGHTDLLPNNGARGPRGQAAGRVDAWCRTPLSETALGP